ncbi:hypothetical protein T11_8665 [Trichinella zimbabwensis]|uniref:Uncharacterized protein n=1 Tax=Trichinella zimbabwensis TaxID=268475 RepID=A0A0V1GAX6_9BILA|nr:hypothetical protein T11_8665 [Trichinella zimbabwensis]
MTGIHFEKLQNHNEPGRTLHGTSFVEIVAFTRTFLLISPKQNVPHSNNICT